MGTADLHIHSTYSDGYQTIGQILSHVETKTELDVIAITDHDCIEGALIARDLASKRMLRTEIIVGAEITTRDGHLLALDIYQLIPAGLSMADTIQAVHEQGGLAVVAHPLCRWCSSATLDTLIELDSDNSHTPDGVEAINGSFAGIGHKNRIRELNNAQFGWAETGSSDAHTLRAIGSGYTHFLGTTATDLLTALRGRRTVAYGGHWPARSFMRYGIGVATGR